MFKEIGRWRKEGSQKQTVGYNSENPFPLYNFVSAPSLYSSSQL